VRALLDVRVDAWEEIFAPDKACWSVSFQRVLEGRMSSMGSLRYGTMVDNQGSFLLNLITRGESQRPSRVMEMYLGVMDLSLGTMEGS